MYRTLLLSAVSAAVALTVSLAASSVSAATRTVGSGRQHATLAQAVAVMQPGDVIEVYDDETYPTAQTSGIEFPSARSGTAGSPITVRGMTTTLGRRPRLSGARWTVQMNASHFVLENFEVTAGTHTCLRHYADDVTVRNVVVHDCVRNGLLGTDTDSGSLTLEYTEIYNTGADISGENLAHQIYMATDESAHPGSVFRMQHCWVHDGRGGNNVKSRAERNEIFYNWIEEADIYELELIGPDIAGSTPTSVREDSDVVGNVLVKAPANIYYAVRVGGDRAGTETNGAYRFVNNTFVGASSTPGLIRMYLGIASLEISNNVFYRVGGGAFSRLWRDVEGVWVGGTERIAGANNWVMTGSMFVPSQLTGTTFGTNPQFVDAATVDVRPTASSPLVNAGSASPPAPASPIPSPLAAPLFMPVRRAVPAVGAAPARASVGVIDIGAYEFGNVVPTPDAGPADTSTADTRPADGSAADTRPTDATNPTDTRVASDVQQPPVDGVSPTDTATSDDTGALDDAPAASDSATIDDAAVTDDAGALVPLGGPEDDGGCGCRTTPRRSDAPLLGVFFAALVVAWRRRARSSQSPSQVVGETFSLPIRISK